MHPILTSGQRLTLYVGSWFLIALLLSAAYSAAAAASAIEAVATVVPLSLVFGFICLSSWYVCRSVPIQTSGASRIFATHLLSAVFASGLWLVLWEMWTAFMEVYPWMSQSVAHYRSQVLLIFVAGILLFWLASMFHYLLIAFENSRQAETRQLGLEILAREAELKALRAQIDPHFLFNSLHSISALTTADPQGARRMCLLLADFFRSSIRLGEKERISLDEELTMVRQYLEIERVRFGSRLDVAMDIDPQCGDWPVPPLILQPLVENSVRHGINTLVEGGAIRIAARCVADRLRVTIENPVDAITVKNPGAGMGLANVKHRLRTLFDHEGEMHIAQTAQSFRVEIAVPFRESGANA